MVTSGLIFAALALLLVLGVTLVVPFCTPAVVFFLGPICGFLAPHLEKVAEKSLAVKRATYAGGIAGIGAVVGQIIGATINAQLVGPEKAAALVRSLGLPAASDPGFAGGYWAGLIISTLCLALLNVFVASGMGALGGLLWWQWVGAKRSASPLP